MTIQIKKENGQYKLTMSQEQALLNLARQGVYMKEDIAQLLQITTEELEEVLSQNVKLRRAFLRSETEHVQAVEDAYYALAKSGKDSKATVSWLQDKRQRHHSDEYASATMRNLAKKRKPTMQDFHYMMMERGIIGENTKVYDHYSDYGIGDDDDNDDDYL